MRNDREKLLKLLQENPELPIVFFAPSDEFLSDFSSTVFNDYSSYKTRLYVYDYYGDNAITDDDIEVLEFYEDLFSDNEEYKDLSDDEYEKVIKKYIEDNIETYEAIVISLS